MLGFSSCEIRWKEKTIHSYAFGKFAVNDQIALNLVQAI